MKKILQRPAVFFGIISGICAVIIQFGYYLTKNWELLYSSLLSTLLFTACILAGMIWGSLSDRKSIKRYHYWQAMLSMLVVVLTSTIVRNIGTQILVKIDRELPEKTKSIIIKVTIEKMVQFKTPQEKIDQTTEELEKKDAAEFFNLTSVMFDVIGKGLAYGILAFAIAPFVRSKEKWYEEDKSTEVIESV